jgi:hypothetical protein
MVTQVSLIIFIVRVVDLQAAINKLEHQVATQSHQLYAMRILTIAAVRMTVALAFARLINVMGTEKALA